MSLSLQFISQVPKLQALRLPTRYYHFSATEDYVKLLNIGEGIFPGDRVNLAVRLQKSRCILTTESATKVYPSRGGYGINRFDFRLEEHSELECINDELILFKAAKYLQLLTFSVDGGSYFFYVDILSNGRSFEHFDFTAMQVRNRFFIEGELEYFEQFNVAGTALQSYQQRRGSRRHLHAKIYVKSRNNTALEARLRAEGFTGFTFSHTGKMLVGTLVDDNMAALKASVKRAWTCYRALHGRQAFNLGKQ